VFSIVLPTRVVAFSQCHARVPYLPPPRLPLLLLLLLLSLSLLPSLLFPFEAAHSGNRTGRVTGYGKGVVATCD
jgi:hypothetical protein